MKKNIFIQKLIFTLTSGSLLFYLISFDSNGHPITHGIETEQCRIDLQKVRSGKPLIMRQKFQVTHLNVLKLATVEQRLLTHYIHLTGITLVKDGRANPMRLTTYKMESPSRRNLGYKVVIDTENEKEDVLTYYTSKEGDILFWYWDSYQPVQEWTCGND
jgi:hypothetical protein